MTNFSEAREKRFLLIHGCPRSGTTAVWNTLREHQHIVLGLERYAEYLKRHKTLHQALFGEERFFELHPGDTWYDDFKSSTPYYSLAKSRYGAAKMVGDKIPLCYRYLENLRTELPGVIFISPLRRIEDVANSYKHRQIKGTLWPRGFDLEMAIQEWNYFLQASIEQINQNDFILLDYDDMFYSRSDIFVKVLDMLSLKHTSKFIEAVRWMRDQAANLQKRRTNILTDEELCILRGRANLQLYEEVRALALRGR